MTEGRAGKRVKSKTVSARELGSVLNQLSKLIGSRPTSNRRIADALFEAGRMLESLGSLPFHEAFRQLESPLRSSRPDRGDELGNLPLERVREIASDPDSSRRFLIDLGVSRFRMSRSSLERRSVGAVRDELMTAVQHESSISIISDVARRG